MFVREVLIPGALPMIFTGLRLSLQACWTTLVAGELIGAIAGLGHVLYQASLDIFPAMIVVGMAAVADHRRGDDGAARRGSSGARCRGAAREDVDCAPRVELPFRRWLALSVAGFVAFFAIWWLIAVSGLVQRQFLPTPLEVLEKFVALTQSPFVGYTLQQHLRVELRPLRGGLRACGR